MQTYKKYKYSGVEWIGEIPEHWKTLRLRFVCELRNGYTPSKANPDFWSEGTIPWYRMEDIRESGRRLNEAKQYITESAIKGGGLFEAGSFIMATTATIGEHAVLIVDSLANQQFTNLKIRKSLSHSDFNAFFFQYLFVVDDYCKTTTKTATFPAVNMEDLKNFIVCIPPLDEQKNILAYLDKKCADIDKVIATQQRRIELLQELKQSTITHAVTRGLNPNVKMKDSGVEWIGEVPEHWKICKIKNITNLFGRIGFRGYNQTDIVEEGEGAITLSPSNMKEGKMDYDKCSYLSWEKYYESPEIMINDQEILFVKTGSTYGKTAYVENLTMQATINPQIVVFKELKCESKFLYYILSNDIIQTQVQFSVGGSTIPTLSQNNILNYRLAVPPLSEQQAIATYLDKKCAELDASISKAQKEIDLLQEYKQALITEVVTGKRKVC